MSTGGYEPPNYPPPPSGGFGDYGATPPPQSLRVGDAISYGWNRYKQNVGVWIAFVVIVFVIQAVIQLIFGNGRDFDDITDLSDVSTAFTFWNALGGIVSVIVGYIINAAYVRGALSEVDGIKPALGTFFQFKSVGAVILAGILVGVGTTIGFVLCILPGLFFLFVTLWTMQFVVDRDQDPISAIKSSYRTIMSNAGTIFLLVLAILGLNIVGALLCGLGLLVSMPVTAIATTYAYRVVTGGQVVPVAA